jgi:hypothetical protein
LSVTGKGLAPVRTSVLTLVSLLVILLSTMAFVRPLIPNVLAEHVEPTAIAGNASCGELGDFDFEFKIDESPETGTYSDPNSDFEVEIVLNSDGSIDFVANHPVDAVFVKGGNEGGNLYVYDPAVTADTGLDTPTGQGISHVSFCFHDMPVVTPTPTPTATEAEDTPTPTPTEAEDTPTPTPTGSEQAETPTPTPTEAEDTPTPTPAGSEQAQTPTQSPRESQLGGNPTAAPPSSVPNTALGDGGFGSPAAIVLAVLTLISVGALAFVRLVWAKKRA